MGARARWHAWSHSLMGSVARVDYQVSLLLALADARTNESAFRLLDTYQRVGLDQRTALLAVLPDPVDNAGAFERVADWVSRLAGLRNQLAHSVIVDAESASAASTLSIAGAIGRESSVEPRWATPTRWRVSRGSHWIG